MVESVCFSDEYSEQLPFAFEFHGSPFVLEEFSNDHSNPGPQQATTKRGEYIAKTQESTPFTEKGDGLETERGKRCESTKHPERDEDAKKGLHDKSFFENRHEKSNEETSDHVHE
jgi:hypothetical protein